MKENLQFSDMSLEEKPSMMNRLSTALKRLININTLAVIIAFLQLIIAYPTLKLMIMSKNDKIAQTTNRFSEQLKNMEFVSIPDSLMNEDIRHAQQLQKEIYTLSLIVANSNYSSKEKPVVETQLFYISCLISKLKNVYDYYGRQAFSSMDKKSVRNSFLFLSNDLEIESILDVNSKKVAKDRTVLAEKTLEISYKYLIFLTEIQFQNMPGINIYYLDKSLKNFRTNDVYQYLL